jgi:hypothetical protein
MASITAYIFSLRVSLAVSVVSVMARRQPPPLGCLVD